MKNWPENADALREVENKSKNGLMRYILIRVFWAVVTLLGVCLIIFFVVDRTPGDDAALIEKPVIYLYPERETEVRVELAIDGKMTASEPEYGGGWSVTACPDGTIKTRDGGLYPWLFWEAEVEADFDISSGFCVRGEDCGAFLASVLSEIGLTDAEAEEFIGYWEPGMRSSPWVLISFQKERYERLAQLRVSPEPQSVLRVFMAWKKLERPLELAPQTFEPFVRRGFTVVEWGGCEIK